MNKQEAPENITQSAFGAVCRERDQAQKDLDEERHAWEEEREEWQADYAAVSLENKAMREAIMEAWIEIQYAEAGFAGLALRVCPNDSAVDSVLNRMTEALAKLKPFLA